MKIQTKIANKLISTSINDDWYWVQELNDRIKTLSVKHLPCSRKRAVSFTSKSSPTDSCIAEGSTCFATIYVMSFQLREKHTSATTQKETSPLCNLALIMLARSSIGGESHVQTSSELLKLWLAILQLPCLNSHCARACFYRAKFTLIEKLCALEKSRDLFSYSTCDIRDTSHRHT